MASARRQPPSSIRRAFRQGRESTATARAVSSGAARPPTAKGDRAHSRRRQWPSVGGARRRPAIFTRDGYHAEVWNGHSMASRYGFELPELDVPEDGAVQVVASGL